MSNRFVIMERREKVYSMLSQGLNELEIAKQLNVDQSTICRDLNNIKKESQRTIQDIAKKVLPFEFGKSILSLQQITRACWNIYEDKTGQWTNKDKLNALKLLKESIRTKFEILCDGPTVLQLQKLQDEVIELKQQSEPLQQSFMVLPDIQTTNDEDLK